MILPDSSLFAAAIADRSFLLAVAMMRLLGQGHEPWRIEIGPDGKVERATGARVSDGCVRSADRDRRHGCGEPDDRRSRYGRSNGPSVDQWHRRGEAPLHTSNKLLASVSGPPAQLTIGSAITKMSGP